MVRVFNKIKLAIHIPLNVDKFNEWFSGNYAHSIRFESTEYLVTLYENLFNLCTSLNRYGLKKRYRYYSTVLRKIDKELTKRSELFDEDPEKYFATYGRN